MEGEIKIVKGGPQQYQAVQKEEGPPSMPRTDHSRKTLKNGKCHPHRDGREPLPADQSVEPDANTEPTSRTARRAHGTP